MLDSGVVGECNVRDRDGGLLRPRGRFLCLTVILKRRCYNEVWKKRLLDPHLVGETLTSFIPVCADDAFAWVSALTSSCHAAAADLFEGIWTRFTINQTDENWRSCYGLEPCRCVARQAEIRIGLPGQSPWRL